MKESRNKDDASATVPVHYMGRLSFTVKIFRKYFLKRSKEWKKTIGG